MCATLVDVSGFLKNKCTVLVTHQLQYLKHVSRIYVMENGKIAANGDYHEIQNSDGDYAQMFKGQLEEEDEASTETGAYFWPLTSVKRNKFSLFLVPKPHYHCEPVEEEPTEIKESRATGSIAGKVYKAYFKAAGGWFSAALVLILFVVTQMASSAADYFIKFW